MAVNTWARLRRAIARHRDLHRQARALTVRVAIHIDPQVPFGNADIALRYRSVERLPRPLRKDALRWLRQHYLMDPTSRASWPWSDDPGAEARDKAKRAARLRAKAERMEALADRLAGEAGEEEA